MTGAVLTAAAPERKFRGAFDYQRLVDYSFFLTIGLGSIVAVEPSPYDFLILITIGLWVLGGFSVHRAVLPFIVLLSFWVLGGYLGLVPYWHEDDPVSFMVHTVFIVSTGIFFSLYVSQRTTRRLDLLLNGYAVSCAIAATVAVLAWFGVIGSGDEWVKDGRAMGPYKDPNVFGTYLVLGITYLVQRLLLGNFRFLWLALPGLAVTVTGVFLSLSRGSWGATIVSTILIAAFLIKTADARAIRLRIAAAAAAVALAAVLALTAVLTVDSLHDIVFERAAVQDYDQGPNGRFGNQIRSIPMLLDRPNGFGPLRFRLTFGLEPHNSYINAFASNGWLGGFSFISLTLATWFIGFRLCLTRHPWSRQAQVLFAATFVSLLQGFQIDIDHWRQFYLSFGAVWGIEAARQRWLVQQSGAGADSGERPKSENE